MSIYDKLFILNLTIWVIANLNTDLLPGYGWRQDLNTLWTSANVAGLSCWSALILIDWLL